MDPDTQAEDSQAIAEQGLAEQSVSEEQAVQLVREKLGIPESSDTIVELDGIGSDGEYVIHAYNVVIDDTMVDQFADLE
ncbi:hypothetical protein [Priestia megaterium]|uniref:hypothetical protein n=1 Tax=Priestia megaterium TaxID=1404 RepID=UPI001EDD72EF|nr:hypothetical protein [Priestia megaterium]MDH3170295.1 hypothetical protein [Priestia megaterium]